MLAFYQKLCYNTLKKVEKYYVILTLGSIQPRTTSTIQRLSQQMELQEKENNPDEVA